MTRKLLTCFLLVLMSALLLFTSACGGGTADTKSNKGKSNQSATAGTSDAGASGTTSENKDGGASGTTSDSSQKGGSAAAGSNKSSRFTRSKSNQSRPAGTVDDFEGYEFIFGTAYYGNYKNSRGVLDPTNPLMKAVAQVEKEYNCKVKFLSFPSVAAAGTQIINAVMSGTKLCDVAEVQFSRARMVAKAKASHDLKTLPGLDLNNGNFSEPMTFANTFNNKVYATYAGSTANIQGLFYNKQLLSTYAPGYDIEKLYKEGEWTEEKFEEILRKIKLEGKNGLTGDTGILALTSAANAGGTTFKTGNTVTFGIVTDNGVIGLNYVKRLYDDGLWVRGQNFNSGGAVFAEGALWMGKNYADISKGFIPWPKGKQNQYIVPLGDGPAWCVPTTVSRTYVGTILNALSVASAEYQSNLRKEYAAAGFSGHSLEVIQWAQKNHRVDLTTGPEIGPYSAKIDDSVFNKNSQPATAMQSIRAAAQQAYNDYYSTFGK